MKVAAVQFAPQFKAPVANLSQAASMVLQAAKAGAQLIVLPELMTTGYSFQSEAEALPFAEDLMEGGGSMKLMGQLANELNVAIAWGVMRRESGSGELFNSQVLMLPGLNWWSYDKANLWANDYLWAKEGRSSPPVVKFQDKKVGLLICRDVRDKTDVWDDLYEKGDADIICFSSNWGNGGFPAVRWVKFARDNEVFLIVGNRFGKERNNNFGQGGVCVIEPCGKVHCEGLEWNQPCIVLADTD